MFIFQSPQSPNLLVTDLLDHEQVRSRVLAGVGDETFVSCRTFKKRAIDKIHITRNGHALNHIP